MLHHLLQHGYPSVAHTVQHHRVESSLPLLSTLAQFYVHCAI